MLTRVSGQVGLESRVCEMDVGGPKGGVESREILAEVSRTGKDGRRRTSGREPGLELWRGYLAATGEDQTEEEEGKEGHRGYSN